MKHLHHTPLETGLMPTLLPLLFPFYTFYIFTCFLRMALSGRSLISTLPTRHMHAACHFSSAASLYLLYTYSAVLDRELPLHSKAI